MSLGERIKEQRKSCGLSQEKVAELVGVSRQAVAVREPNLIASRRLLFASSGVISLERLIPFFAKSHQNPSKINSP